MTKPASNPSALAAESFKTTADNGGSFNKLLQTKNRVPFQVVGAAFSQSELTAIRNALIQVGIMKSA